MDREPVLADIGAFDEAARHHPPADRPLDAAEVDLGAHATGHPVIASAQPGERWLYCYPDDAFVEY